MTDWFAGNSIWEAVVLGFILDLILGDPAWLYHPVRVIGKGIDLAERLTRSVFPASAAGERAAGGLTAILVMTFSTGIPILLLGLAGLISPWLRLCLETFWCCQLLATRSLYTESMKVFRALTGGDLEGARYAVSMIVGRDTDCLDEEGVARAAVETVAENSSDGIIAPLLFMIVGGAAGGFFYKSINTMDSMIGYKNDRYRYFGTFAARLDDLVNFIPARIAGIVMAAAAWLTPGFRGREAWQVFLRDRKKHASPNSAHTEAAMAGALGVELAGDASYFGVVHKKPSLGNGARPIRPEDIPASNRLVLVTALLCLLIFTGVRIGLGLL